MTPPVCAQCQAPFAPGAPPSWVNGRLLCARCALVARLAPQTAPPAPGPVLPPEDALAALLLSQGSTSLPTPGQDMVPWSPPPDPGFFPYPVLPFFQMIGSILGRVMSSPNLRIVTFSSGFPDFSQEPPSIRVVNDRPPADSPPPPDPVIDAEFTEIPTAPKTANPDNPALPPGKTCRDCHYWPRCHSLISGLTGTETRCDWSPSRFLFDS